jgi:hypothetical protein
LLKSLACARYSQQQAYGRTRTVHRECCRRPSKRTPDARRRTNSTSAAST